MSYLNKSYWLKTTNKDNFPELDKDSKFDVLIIGGGIAGLTTAYLLKDSNLNIGLIDSGVIGYGTTGFTSAKITVQHGLKYHYLIDSFGKNKAMQYLEANRNGADLIKDIINKNNINCDYKTQSSYVYTTNEQEIHLLEDEFNAYSKLGINGEYTTKTELPFTIEAAIKIPNQSQFHPIKYLYSLLEIVKKSNCSIFENTTAIDIDGMSSPYEITTNKGKIVSKYVVVASHFPFLKGHGLYFMRMHQEKSYVIALDGNNKPFNGMYINVSEPTYSMRYHFSKNNNFLLLGGGNHKTGKIENEIKSYNDLYDFAKEHFNDPKILSKWSTQDCMPIDKVPYIGQMSKNSKNLFVATGFGKWGMTGGSAAAAILKDLILEKKNQNSEIFCPQRFTPKESAKEFLSNSATSVQGLLNNVINISLRDVEHIKNNEGKIVEYEGKRIGIFRDAYNKFFGITPICTHLGCQLKFNTAEKTWDCQCHGSRFDIEGKVIEGPAVQHLERINFNKEDEIE